ncbi:isoprenylcysteine carboxylmethyltransferase family protein [Luteibacter sp. PPL554]
MTTETWLKTGIDLAWKFVAVYWLWHAWGNKATLRTEGWLTQSLLYWAPLVVAFVLLGPGEWFGHSWLREGIVPHVVPVFAVALLLVVAGATLACWSRHLLGRNWSSVVQVKREHELVESDPYRWIRHPIYTGLLLMFAGSALDVGDVRGILAVGIVLVSFGWKLRAEERMMQATFGDRYLRYRQRTAALIPGVW